MKCSDCKLFRTDQCRENPEGKDLDFADSFECFVPGGAGAAQVEQEKPKPAAKAEKKPEPVKQPKPEPAAKVEKKPPKVEKARPAPVRAEKEPPKAEEAKPEPVEVEEEPPKAKEVKPEQRRKRRPAVVAATGARAPWGWDAILLLSVVGGFAVAGVVAGLNWKKLGRRSLMLPTIAVAALAFVFWLALPALMSGQTLTLIPISIFANSLVAWGLWRWQGDYYHAWSEANPSPRPAGWFLPAVALAAVWVIVLIIVAVYNLL